MKRLQNLALYKGELISVIEITNELIICEYCNKSGYPLEFPDNDKFTINFPLEESIKFKS